MLTEVWRVTLLGGLRAEQRGMSIDRFRTRKTAGLLAYLAFHAGRRHDRESEMCSSDADQMFRGDGRLALRTGGPPSLARVSQRASVDILRLFMRSSARE
jgi:hypothetical protein